jgi:hypothetical protein
MNDKSDHSSIRRSGCGCDRPQVGHKMYIRMAGIGIALSRLIQPNEVPPWSEFLGIRLIESAETLSCFPIPIGTL